MVILFQISLIFFNLHITFVFNSNSVTFYFERQYFSTEKIVYIPSTVFELSGEIQFSLEKKSSSSFCAVPIYRGIKNISLLGLKLFPSRENLVLIKLLYCHIGTKPQLHDLILPILL